MNVSSTTTTTTASIEEEEEGEEFAGTKAWKFCGADIPKSEIVYFSQVIIIYAIIVTSLYQLAVQDNDNPLKHLWTSLLSSSLGYLLPSPTIKRKK